MLRPTASSARDLGSKWVCRLTLLGEGYRWSRVSLPGCDFVLVVCFPAGNEFEVFDFEFVLRESDFEVETGFS